MAELMALPSHPVHANEIEEGRYLPGVREDEQKERLLSPIQREESSPSDLDNDDDTEVVTSSKWLSRTSHVPVTNILIAIICFVFVGMILLQIRGKFQNVTKAQIITESTFRRPSSDYILNHRWLFGIKPIRRQYRWRITDEEVNPDGVYRSMILINGQFPGPMIECNEGDTLSIEVDNQSVNATSFHWHGIYQNGSNWMDGTVGVTQCPIAPNKTFTYEFTIKGQSGTYWYHSHHGLQAADGLFGPLIIHSAREKEHQMIKYSTNRVIMIQDYYHDLSSSLMPGYLSNDRENAEPVPAGALINGQNIRDCNKLPHRRCDNTTATPPIIDLRANENHRLRIINTGVLSEFQFEIDEHELAVTEVDGTDVLPSYIHRLIINPAQRYSLIVSTNLTSSNSFWLRMRIATDCLSPDPGNPDLIAETNGIVRYINKKKEVSTNLPISKPWGQAILQICKDLNTAELVPVPVVAAPEVVDHTYYMVSNFRIGAWRLSRGFFNDSSWRPNLHSPVLNRFIDGWQAQNQSFLNANNEINSKAYNTASEMVIQVDGIKTIDIVIQNVNEGNHPMHLHGHKYWVLAQGHGWFHKEKYLQENNLDLSNPLRRDTASAEGYGWLWIRLVTDNPGAWAFHCHISWHAEAGLQMQFLTRPDVIGSWTLPKANQELCMAPGIEKGANLTIKNVTRSTM